MSDASLIATPRRFEFKGRKFVVCPRDLATQWTFSDWVLAEAGLALARMKPRWPAEFYAEQMRIFNSKVAGKQFRWGSEEVHNASWSEEGQRELLYLKMARGQEHGGEAVERDLLDDIASDEGKYAELVRIMMEQDYPFVLKGQDRSKETPSPPDSPLPPASDSTTKA